MRGKTRDVRNETRGGNASLAARPTPRQSNNQATKQSNNKLLSRARQVFDCEIEGLRRTRDSLGQSFADAVGLVLSALRDDGHVVVTGVGKSLHVAEKISGILSSTGARSFVLNPVQAMHGDLGSTSARDILLALSFSGESEEVLRLIPAIRRHGLKVVSMTGDDGSTLAGLSDVHVTIPCGREACPFGMAPTTSAAATMVMGDALAMALLEAQKFDVSDYALNHPAGAIGKALVMKASDIMRTGVRLPLVPPAASVLATLMAMTKAQSGAAIVVDESGGLLGIFTDGDFRRVMSGAGGAKPRAPHASRVSQARSNALLAASVSSVMTASPRFVYEDAYAVELLKVFEKMRIDDLPVCDHNGRVVGLVDIQDLPRVKVM